MPKSKKKAQSKKKEIMYKGVDVLMVKESGRANSYYDLVEEYKEKYGEIKLGKVKK